jgi:hypothetical protein
MTRVIYRHFEVSGSESTQESGNGDVCHIECDSVSGAASEGRQGQPNHPCSYKEIATSTNDTTR